MRYTVELFWEFFKSAIDSECALCISVLIVNRYFVFVWFCFTKEWNLFCLISLIIISYTP